MPLSAARKMRLSLNLDRQWLRLAAVAPRERLGYVLRKYAALLRGAHRVRYLGQTYVYDNPTTPATLQSYGAEITYLAKWCRFTAGCTVLDVGANTGQFALTLSKLYPNVRIFSFEANPAVFAYLDQNIAASANIAAFNTAIGPAGRLPFYWVEGYSAKGSFIRENAMVNLVSGELKTVEVDVVELNAERCAEYSVPQRFDLVKIDVEGFEADVLAALTGIKTKLLWLEFSARRARGAGLLELLRIAEDKWGQGEIVYCDPIDLADPSKTMGNALVRFANPDRSTTESDSEGEGAGSLQRKEILA